MHPALRGYELLLKRIQEHTARVEEKHSSAMACRAGCSGCCQVDLSVSALEAEVIRRWLKKCGLPPSEGSPDSPAPFVSPLTVLEPETAKPCAMLDAAGHCRIHPVRPVVCRTQGLPLAVPDQDGGLRGDVCPLNFDGGEGLAGLPSSDFLSVATLTTQLTALNLQWEAHAPQSGQRTLLSLLAAEGEDSAAGSTAL